MKTTIITILVALVMLTGTATAHDDGGQGHDAPHEARDRVPAKSLAEQVKDVSEATAHEIGKSVVKETGEVITDVIDQTGETMIQLADDFTEKGGVVIEKIEPVAVIMVEETGKLYGVKGLVCVVLTLLIAGTFSIMAWKTIYNEKVIGEWDYSTVFWSRFALAFVVMVVLWSGLNVAGGNFAKAVSPTRTLLVEVIEASTSGRSNSNTTHSH